MGRNQIFVGFVIHYAGNGASYAWCKKLKNDIVIDNRYCPPNTNILARWVEIELDETFRVCRPIRIINDLYESTHDGKFAEVKVQIRPDHCYHNIEMFTNYDLGLIGDPKHVIGRVEIDGVYDVWITSSGNTDIYRNTGARWVVSTRNMNVAPMNRRNEMQSANYNIDTQAARSQYTRRRSPENYGYNRPPSRSPQRPSQQFDNSYDNDNYRRRDDWNRNSYDYQPSSNSVHGSDGRRSPGPRRCFQNDNNFSRNHPADNEMNRPYRDAPSVRSQPSFDRDPLSNIYPLNERRSRTPDRNMQNQNNYRYSPAPPLANNFTTSGPQEPANAMPRGSSRLSSQYIRPRSRSASSRSRAETTSESEDDLNEPPKIVGPIKDSQKKGESKNESNGAHPKSPLVQNNEPTPKDETRNQVVVETRQEQLSSYNSAPSHQATLDNAREQIKICKPQKTAEEKEMAKLKTKVTLMKNLILSLTTSKDVCDKMMLASLEEFEELMAIVKQ